MASWPSTPHVGDCSDLRPTYARIDLEVLRSNLRAVQRHVGPACRVLAVVKADAYGHGAIEASRTFVDAGAWGLAVSLVEEGVELREGGVEGPILVLGGVLPHSADVIVHRALIPVVWSSDHLQVLASAVRRSGMGPLRVHVKVDTGMSRLGVLPEDLPELIDWFCADEGQSLQLDGLMTHFACADDIDDDVTSLRQIAAFRGCVASLSARGLIPNLIHASNSAGLVRFHDAHFDMVRPGIVLYGSSSSPAVALPGLRLAMSVRSRILGLRALPRSTRVSYGGRDRLSRDSILAIVPVGYADGYPRNMTGRAQMLVRGHRCRVVGTITMDVCMLDVTDIPAVRVGEEVTLLGDQGLETIDLHEMADWAATIPYEITCGISKRVPRHFVNADRPYEPSPEPCIGWDGEPVAQVVSHSREPA